MSLAPSPKSRGGIADLPEAAAARRSSGPVAGSGQDRHPCLDHRLKPLRPSSASFLSERPESRRSKRDRFFSIPVLLASSAHRRRLKRFVEEGAEGGPWGRG